MIITLCGSARFEKHFHAWNEALTLNGHTVFSLSNFPSIHGSKDFYTPEIKGLLDKAHLRKIDASHAILLLNVGGYVGDSARREVIHATKVGKKLYALESWGAGVTTPAGYEITFGTSHWLAEPWDLAPLRGGYLRNWSSDGYDPRVKLGLYKEEA